MKPDIKTEDQRVSDLQRRIDAINWYHEFDFGSGLHAEPKTPDAQSHRALWRFIEGQLDLLDFAGKTVLDIGCWDGYWSFYAERRRAQRVLATDDTSQNWAGEAGFALAHELLESSVDFDLQRSVYDLDVLGDTFDIILCLGIYYHLFDPFFAFSQIRHRCHEKTIVVIEGDAFFGLDSFLGRTEESAQSSALYSRNLREAPRFVPDPEVLRFLANAAYLNIESEAVHPLSPRGINGSLPRGVHRLLLTCRPLDGLNSCHVYQPPFGLQQYDARHGLPPEQWPSRLP
jgi:tRNA (mo5U34)-methyltransferase